MITINTVATPGQLECRVSGHLTQADYEDTLSPALEQAFSTSDTLRVLVIIDNDLSGMDAGAVWEDTKLGLAHWRGFDRLAVVTDLGFARVGVRAFAPLMPCPVQVFAHVDIDAARLWLRESLSTIHAQELAPGTMELCLLGEVDAGAYTRANEALAAHVRRAKSSASCWTCAGLMAGRVQPQWQRICARSWPTPGKPSVSPSSARRTGSTRQS